MRQPDREYRMWNLRLRAVPQRPGAYVTVLWPHADELPALAESYFDAAATRLLHSVALRELGDDR